MVISDSSKVCAQVSLFRSIKPTLVDNLDREFCVPAALSEATRMGLVKPGDRVLLLSGHGNIQANRMESFVAGEIVPTLGLLTGQHYQPGSSLHAP